MALEIERKFTVKNEDWKGLSYQENNIAQGYLNSSPDRTVRIRISNNEGFITIKSKNSGAVRSEFEYSIPLNEATELLAMCEKPTISKTRYLIDFKNHTWEVDVFKEENQGLIVAEIELSSQNESFEIPKWIGEEVTHDKRYYNSALISFPFCEW